MSIKTLQSSSIVLPEAVSNKAVFLETIKQFEKELNHLQAVISTYRTYKCSNITEALNFNKKK